MKTWAIVMWILLVGGLVCRLWLIGFGDYPRTSTRQEDSATAIAELALVIIGALLIWCVS